MALLKNLGALGGGMGALGGGANMGQQQALMGILPLLLQQEQLQGGMPPQAMPPGMGPPQGMGPQVPPGMGPMSEEDLERAIQIIRARALMQGGGGMGGMGGGMGGGY